VNGTAVYFLSSLEFKKPWQEVYVSDLLELETLQYVSCFLFKTIIFFTINLCTMYECPQNLTRSCWKPRASDLCVCACRQSIVEEKQTDEADVEGWLRYALEDDQLIMIEVLGQLG